MAQTFLQVHQEGLDGTLVDMGPNWVHGTDRNPIVQLAASTRTDIRTLGEDTRVYGPSGEVVATERAKRLNDVIWDIISEAFAYSNRSCADIAPDLSLKDFFREKLPHRRLNEADEVLAMHMGEMWGSFIGENWEKQSLKWFWLEECLDGENLYVIDSHKKTVDRIAQSVWKHADVLLKARVTLVEDLPAAQDDPRVSVTMQKDGREEKYDFDEVVIAVPLGCLKRDSIVFAPPLPSDIRTAVDNASISSLEKVYVTFPTAFWDTKTVPDTAGSHDCAHNPTQSEPTHFPGFANFLHPSYAAPTHHTWSFEANPLSNPDVFGSHARPTMLFTLFGHSSRSLTTLINNITLTSPQYLQIITTFLQPYYSLLPNYSPTNPCCKPRAVLATNWQNDELAGNGSYTNFQVHEPGRQVELDEDVRAMRCGMPERGVWLAGEHTAPLVGLGTSTGAYWSGESVGMRILGMNGFV